MRLPAASQKGGRLFFFKFGFFIFGFYMFMVAGVRFIGFDGHSFFFELITIYHNFFKINFPMKNSIIAAVLIFAINNSTAQTQTITAKCPCTDSLSHWDYTKQVLDNLETIENEKTRITLDWTTNKVIYNDVVFRMDSFSCSAEEPKTTISFLNLELTLKYNEKGQYRGHILNEKSPQR